MNMMTAWMGKWQTCRRQDRFSYSWNRMQDTLKKYQDQKDEELRQRAMLKELKAKLQKTKSGHKISSVRKHSEAQAM